MGQSSVILAIAAVLTVGILAFAAQRSTGDADVELAAYHEKVLAREASFTGINMTVRRLVDDPDNWQATPDAYEYTDEPYYGATFTTTVTAPHPDTVDIVSTGVDSDGTHVIEARYAKGFTTHGVPPSLRYAIISDEDLTLNGKANIIGLNDESNANIHANGHLTSNGTQVNVEGYGSYGPDGSGTVNPERAMDDVFDPNVDNNEAEPNVYGDDYVEIADIDPNDFNTVPPATIVTISDTSLTGVIDLQAWATSMGYGPEVGTAESPFLLYIEGDAQISGDVTILGYGQIVANGNIDISGNVVTSTEPMPDSDDEEAWDAWVESSLDAAGNTTVGFYATGNIALSGNSVVVGQLYANGEVQLNGGGGQELNLIGGIVSSNIDINVNGGVNIQYAQLSESSVLPGWENVVPEGVRLIAWAEF